MFEQPQELGPSGEAVYGDPANKKVIARERPEPDEATKAQVANWVKRVNERRIALKESVFKTMHEDMDFVEGYQVMGGKNGGEKAEQADQYVLNLAQRHVKERVSSLYAKNPKAVAKRRERIDSAVWDGKSESVAPIDMRMAQDTLTKGAAAPEDVAFMMEVSDTLDRRKMLDNVGRSLVLCFNYYLGEAQPPFKTSAKQCVRRAQTCAVGYVKLGFQRLMEKNNEAEGRLVDHEKRLAYIESLAADLADEEFEENERQAAELREAIVALQGEVEVVSYEGLTFDWPDADKVIPGPGCKHILTFTGAKWLAEEHIVGVSEIQERFGVDLKKGDFMEQKAIDPLNDGEEPQCRWYEIYDLKAGVVRHVVEGYCDYLEEPKANPVFFEQGHPYFTLTFNNLESRKSCYPQSDVRILRPVWLEYNRSREALRKHRIANRPAYVGRKGLLSKEDIGKFGNYEDHELIEIAINATEDPSKVIMAKPSIPIDPALYDPEHLFIDQQRATGNQSANMGGTSGASATEVSVAAESRGETIDSDKDGLDDWLTAVARAAGQVLLDQMSPETVKKIAGEGAVWPEMTRAEIAEEVYLEIKAGSSGAPNAAKELADIERVAPTLIQIPGVNPKKLAEHILSRLETGIDLDEWQVEDMPSIQAMNAMAKQASMAPPPGAEGEDPNAQGEQGGNNEEKPPGPEAAQPQFPATEVPAPGMIQ